MSSWAYRTDECEGYLDVVDLMKIRRERWETWYVGDRPPPDERKGAFHQYRIEAFADPREM